MTDTSEFDRIIAALRRALPELQRQHHVASLELFGSVVRGEQSPDSDLDVLVTFERTPCGLRESAAAEEVMGEPGRVSAGRVASRLPALTRPGPPDCGNE